MSWVADFNSLQNSSQVSAAGGSKVTKNLRRKDEVAEKLKAELKLLEWHKLANDAAIKAALVQTKSLKNSPADSPSHIADDAHWIRRVINNEQTKPLEVNRQFVIDYENKEKESAERLAHQVEHHIDTLKDLRTRLEDRAELRSRTAEFREWKKEFSSKKYAVLSGKTLDDFSRESRSAGQPTVPASQVSAGSNSLALSGPAAGATKINRASELSTVLLSLEKLNELEKRITSLEGDNAYDRMTDQEAENERSAAAEKQRLALEFRRKVKGDGTVNRAVYAVRERKKAWEPPKAGHNRAAAGGGVNAARSKKNNTRGGGTFLTDIGDDDGGNAVRPAQNRDKQRAERLREQHLAPAGKKNLKARVQLKKIRVKEHELSKRRHEDALSELQKRRHDNQKHSRPLPPVAKKGASAGVKTNNKYMQDFQKLKQGHAKKREGSSRPPASVDKRVSSRRPAEMTKPSKTVPSRKPEARPVGGGFRSGADNLPPLGAVGNGFNGVRAVKQQAK